MLLLLALTFSSLCQAPKHSPDGTVYGAGMQEEDGIGEKHVNIRIQCRSPLPSQILPQHLWPEETGSLGDSMGCGLWNWIWLIMILNLKAEYWSNYYLDE